MAVLVLLPRPARAGLVSADLATFAHDWLGIAHRSLAPNGAAWTGRCATETAPAPGPAKGPPPPPKPPPGPALPPTVSAPFIGSDDRLRRSVLDLQPARQLPLALALLLLDLRFAAHLHARQQRHRVVLDAIEHRAEQLERLALVLLLRILLRVARAGECPGAGSPSRRGARASADRAAAASPPSRDAA